MFTGIIQEKGKVIDFSRGILEISTNLDLSDCKLGSSICCNGVCLTATEINFISNSYQFKTNVGEETMLRTTFSENLFNKIKPINLEKSLKIGDEVSGHFVFGHVDSTAQLKQIKKVGKSWLIEIKFPSNLKKFIVSKGSISLNGISLTINEVKSNLFWCMIVPHTFQNTDIKSYKTNQILNLEVDMLARYAHSSNFKG